MGQNCYYYVDSLIQYKNKQKTKQKQNPIKSSKRDNVLKAAPL